MYHNSQVDDFKEKTSSYGFRDLLTLQNQRIVTQMEKKYCLNPLYIRLNNYDDSHPVSQG